MPLLAVLVKLVAAAAACRRVGAAAEHGAFSDDVKVISAGGACATDMATMFEGPLRGNLAKWRARERRTAADLRAFVRARWSSRRGHPIMVLNNSVYAPSLPRNVSDTLCAGDGAYCDLRLKLTLDFLRGALADGPAVPDALWWMDLRDEVACTDVLNDCQVPLLGFFINGAAGWGDGGGGGVVGSDFSWDAVEPGGGTLLVPAVHDVDHQLYDYPWHLKRDAAFFRGGGYCHGNKFSETEFFGAKVGCSRSFMYALSKFFNGSALLDAATASEPGPAADGRAPASQPPGFYTVPDHARFKFLLNLEGATLSGRLSKLMCTNSVVMKESSPYIEYFYPQLKPFEHFLPVFERSVLDALELQTEYASRQEELRKIAAASQKFAATYLCKRARQLYWKEAIRQYVGLFEEGAILDVIHKDILPAVRKNGSFWPPEWGGTAWDPNWVLL